jgi:signal transduction histidine kinase/ligand-binding sensor domain-containing protein
MLQDSEGYIWAGTYNGLNRYNGYTFDVFYANGAPSYSLFINVVFSLFEDRDGNIWCGTWGVDVYDKKTGKFKHYNALSGENPISAGEVSAIDQDSQGYIWLATQGGGLNRLNPDTDEIVYFSSKPGSGGNLRSNYINDILIDNKQQLWIAAEDGGLSRMNLSNHSFVHYPSDANDPYSLPSDKISCLFEDKDGNIWIGDTKGHLSMYQPESNNFKSFSFAPPGFDLNRARIMEIAQDLNEKLLLATNGSGLIIYDFKNQKSEVCLHNSFQHESLSSNETYSLLIDHANTVFVGTFGRGISKFSPYSRKFESFAIPESAGIVNKGDINAFTDAIEDAHGNLVTGTYNGFLVFDQKTWNFRHFLPGKTYEENKILTLALAPDQTIWISSMNGLHRYDEHYNKLHSYIFSDSLKDNSIYALEFDHLNNLWIGLFTKGLIKIKQAEWRDLHKTKLDFTMYLVDYNDSTSISGNQHWMIMEDMERNLWIAGVGGIDKYNYETDNFTRLYYPGPVKTFDRDKNDNLWLGTIGSGLHAFNLKTGKTKAYYNKDGLPHSFIYGILADGDNNIWITSEVGLTRFNISSESFRNFDERDGLPDDHFDDKAESKISNGRYYMGTNKGFIIFRPESIRDDITQGRIVLTSMQINNRELNYFLPDEKEHTDPIPVGQIDRLILKPYERDITFGFAALHYAAPHKIEYRFKLEGYDKEWIYTDAAKRIAKYTNLDKGEYSFSVNATNSDGQWTNNPLKIRITVRPPVYRTIIFKIFAVISLFVLIGLIFKWRLSQVVKQRKVLAGLVEERTIEISNKNKLLEKIAEDLKETNALLEERQQFIEEQSEELTAQRDELAVTNATKDKLFSVIAHDLKNPFNVIMGYSDLLISRLYDWNNEKKLYFLTLLKEASEGAYSLLENLLQWSRSQSATIRFNPQPRRAIEVLDEALPEVDNFARKKEISILNETTDTSFMIYSDINMLNTVIRNLVNNAIKFSESGDQVTVDAKPLDENLALFSVRDQGVGMSDEEVQSLFKLNNRSNTGTGGEKGTGIGLILCKDFIDHHKGQIWVESESGVGTTFYFTIPLAK